MTGCWASVEIRASRNGDLNKCSREHLFLGCLFRYAETRVGLDSDKLCCPERESWALEAHACDLRTHEAAVRFEASLWDTAKATNSEREAMGAYVKKPERG